MTLVIVIPSVRYDALMLEPGNGLVTKPSLLARGSLDPSASQNQDNFIPIPYWFVLCENHDVLTGNIGFQDNMLDLRLTGSQPRDMMAPKQQRKVRRQRMAPCCHMWACPSKEPDARFGSSWR